MGSMMNIRNRIIMNTPHLETASGSIASFKTDVPAKLKGCKVYFEPKQEGSGAPSPDNVRNIVGYDSLTVNVNGTDVTVDFPTTVYGGYVDLVSGELVVEEIEYPISGIYINSGISNFDQLKLAIKDPSNIRDVYSDRFSTQVQPGTMGRMSWYMGSVFANLPLGTFPSRDDEGARAWFAENKPTFVAVLATPLRYSLPPQTIRTLKGVNNIYIVEDNTTLMTTYWAHEKVSEEYTRLPYIRNTRYAHLILDYEPVMGDEFDLDFTHEGGESRSRALFSVGTDNCQTIALLDSQWNGFYCRYFTTDFALELRCNLNSGEWYHMSVTSSGKFTSNNVSVTSIPNSEITGTNKRLCIFRRADTSNPLYGKLKTFQVRHDGVLRVNLLPCKRNSDGKVGMYDTVSHKFYSSASVNTEFTE